MRKFGVILFVLAVLLGLTAGQALAVRPGGTLNFMAPYGGDLASLDPHKSNRIQDFLVSMNLNRSLYRWSAAKARPVLELGESVTVSDDGLTYTYKLKKGVKFHNGREMKCDDFIWSYHRIMDGKFASPSARYARVIKGAAAYEKGEAETISGLKKIDDYTLEMTLENPVDPSFPLYEPGTAILPKEEVEKLGDKFSTQPVGAGPFKLVKWVKGSEVVLEKFDGYYEEGKPYLDKVIYKIMSEAAARDMAFKAKELDATIVGSVNYPEYRKDPVISKNLIEVAELWTRLICFNTDYEPFKKKEVRQAFNYAINASLINKKLLKGKAVDTVGYLPPTSPAFDKNAKGYTYDPEKAKELLKAAGYADGFTVECIGTNNGAWGVKAIEATIPFLKKVGITIKPILMEGAAMGDKAAKGEFQALIWSLDSGPDPIVALRRWSAKNTRAAGNYANYNNPEFDKLLDQAAAERDVAKKMALLAKADQVLIDDPPIWFYNYNKAVMAHHPWVHGLKPVAVEMMYQDMTDVWVDDKSPRANAK